MAVWIALGVVALSLAIAFRGYLAFLGGEDLSKYDAAPPVTHSPAPDSPGLAKVNAYLVENFIKPAQAAGASTGWESKRERFEQAGLARTDLVATYKDDVAVIDGQEVPGAWTIVEGADPTKRILYLHGGAFTVGSAVSHRPMTVNMARRTGAVIFTPNYRLMPENHRLAANEDAQLAYRWILENGPHGPAPLKSFAMAGDSAGGTLTWHLLNWARDEGVRAVDAAVTFSAAGDATISGPSMKGNLEKDLMLQPLLRPILKAPRALLLPAMKKHYGLTPSDTRISPIFASLADLPPTLVQVSADEMLYSDAVRYTNKARAAGGDVTLQSWANMPHVFQIFDDALPEAHDAHDAVATFLRQHGF